ncbi:MAG: dockerin type I domain-containing protein, partial [Planctomycetota bacterium]
LPIPYVTEWDADCNNDGLVDYGQILAGELADANLNNIPDCCEQGTPCAPNAVQWRVADGGNGHWYQASSINRRWHDAKAASESIGGHLVTLTSAAERECVWSRLPRAGDDCWIGGFQQPNACEPGCGWTWVTGEPWSYTYWWSVAPDNNPVRGNENVLDTNISGLWDDSADCDLCFNRYAIEWSADCNNDGLIDYGQILAGELADANLNNIPDCCEGGASCNPCPGDVDNSGAVNGVDLAAILNSWGTSGGKYPGADVNHDSVVNGSDLAVVLNGWGPCP